MKSLKRDGASNDVRQNVFEKVASGESIYGVIPIENSLSGSINQNYDLLLEFDLSIWVRSSCVYRTISSQIAG